MGFCHVQIACLYSMHILMKNGYQQIWFCNFDHLQIVGPEYSNGNWFLDIIAAKNADYVIHK